MQGRVSPCWRACSILILWAENSGHLFKLPRAAGTSCCWFPYFSYLACKKKKKNSVRQHDCRLRIKTFNLKCELIIFFIFFL